MMGVVELHGEDILYVSGNAATASFFGLPPDAFGGRLASSLRVHRRHRREYIARYTESLEAGRPVRFELSYRGHGGPRHQSATVCHIAGARARTRGSLTSSRT